MLTITLPLRWGKGRVGDAASTVQDEHAGRRLPRTPPRRWLHPDPNPPSSRGRGVLFAVLCLLLLAAPALADPSFPPLTGRVVDDLTGKLAALEQKTGDQLVVVTLPSLQGYEISDYGYQLGRAWGIGRKDKNTGALFIVAPTEKKVRVEVGYGLEPVLTDAMSSVILNSQVLPRFRQGDISGGVVAGTDALIQQLGLDPAQAQANAQQAAAMQADQEAHGQPRRHETIGTLFSILLFFFVVSAFFRGGRRGGGMGWILPMMFMSGGFGGRDRDDDWGGGGGGGGGFSGGGSFGGGGASGGW
jgi:uncharacterized protein